MKKIKVIIGLALFALQGFLAIAFFFSLGSSTFDAVLLAGIGAMLEIVKRVAWSDAKARASIVAIVLGIALALVSGLASLGFELNSVASSASALSTTTESRGALISQLAALDEESATIRQKQAAIDPSWITSSLRLSSRLDALRASRAQLSVQLAALSSDKKGRGASTLKMLCNVAGLDFDRTIILFFVALSVVLEASVYVTMPTTGKRARRRKALTYKPPRSPEAQAIIDSLSTQSARPYELAKRLGKNPSTTRVMLSKMLDDGTLARSPEGVYSTSEASINAK
jgi:hypothetical protein